MRRRKGRGGRRSREGEEKRNSLAVQWLGFHVFTAMGLSSTSGWAAKILQAAWQKKKKKKKRKRKRTSVGNDIEKFEPMWNVGDVKQCGYY